MLSNEPSYGVNLLPQNGRSLERKGNTKENYQEQLMLDIDTLIAVGVELFEKNGEVSLLDIGGNNSTALQDLKEKLMEKGVPKEKVTLSKIDIHPIHEMGVIFFQGNLEDEDFLISLLEKLGAQSQGIIFMNQVSQYLGDRLKIIKFISEYLLKNGGKFYFNLVLKSFYSGGGIPLSVLETALNEIIQDESYGFEIKIQRNDNLADFRMYEVGKTADDADLEFPEYLRVFDTREVDGFKITAYNFRKRMELKSINAKLETKEKVQNIV